MSSGRQDVQGFLERQCRHQISILRKRRPGWIPWLFVVGFSVSVVGLGLCLATLQDKAWTAQPWVVMFGVFAGLFGWALVLAMRGPYPLRPRIVPYFAQELGRLGGATMAAFQRGSGLYREMVSLERLAQDAGVKPLAAFGFNDDHYEQDVRWHAPAEGLRTVEALRQGLKSTLPDRTEVQADLDALAAVLGVAQEQGTDFSLVLRLHSKESMQGVCTRETRRGSFW